MLSLMLITGLFTTPPAVKLLFECTVSQGDKVVATPKVGTLAERPFEVSTGVQDEAGKKTVVHFKITPSHGPEGITVTVEPAVNGEVAPASKHGNPFKVPGGPLTLSCKGAVTD